MSAAEIETMTNAEKLEAMDSLWSSLTKEGANVDSPEWHSEVLEHRKKRIESGDAQFFSLEEVKEYFS